MAPDLHVDKTSVKVVWKTSKPDGKIHGTDEISDMKRYFDTVYIVEEGKMQGAKGFQEGIRG